MDSKNLANPENNTSTSVEMPFKREDKLQLKTLSVLLIASGLALIIWASFSSYFRDGEEFLTGRFCLLLSVGIAVIIFGWFVKSRYRQAAFWFSLALMGQAVSLQFINAGWQLHYQHYKPIREIFTDSPPFLLIFSVVQIVLVLFGIRSHWEQIWTWGRKNLRLWQLFLICAVFFISGTTVSENKWVYVNELVFAGIIQILNLGNIVLIALTIPKEPLEKLRGFIQRVFGNDNGEIVSKPELSDRFALSLAVFVVVFAALLNIFSYQRHPHVPDEVAYLIHARFFANGALTMPAPPVPEGFEVYLMKIDGNRWYPTPPPGWSMALALGTLLGIPWLVNPFLAGLNLLLVYTLLRELYPKRTARISVFLLAISPWYLFLGMSFMTHIFALTCALLATIGVAWTRRTGNSIWAWLGGLALGMIVLVRPLEAVAMAGLLGLWAIGLGGKRLKFVGIAGLVLGSMIIAGIGLFYNAALTGNPLEFPINAYTNEHFGPNSNAYGFGPDRGMGWAIDPNPGHSPTDALINTNLNVSTLNTELFGWSIGSFLLIALFFCFAKLQRSDYLMLAVIAVIYWLHFFYYFSGGPDFSARYWFLMIVPLLVLTARGIQLLAAKLKESSGDVRLYAIISMLCLMTLLNFIPWRAIDKYHNFRGMRPDIRYLAEKYNFGKSLVLVQGNQHPDYDSAMIYNPLNFQENVPIYVWDRDLETRKKLLAAYADRPVWIIKSPSLTQSGFEVAAGPLKSQDLLQNNDK